jgi:CheY-like chemotaxis protein
VRFEQHIDHQANPISGHLHPLRLQGGPKTPDSRPIPPNEPKEGSERQAFVLIVEDEVDASEAMSEWLADEGFKSLQARNGQEALDILHAGRKPALILLDIKMPVMDGVEFLRQISMEPVLSDIPVTIVTASATPTDVPFRKKNAGFFLKPVDYERLLQTIRSYCR